MLGADSSRRFSLGGNGVAGADSSRGFSWGNFNLQVKGWGGRRSPRGSSPAEGSHRSGFGRAIDTRLPREGARGVSANRTTPSILFRSKRACKRAQPLYLSVCLLSLCFVCFVCLVDLHCTLLLRAARPPLAGWCNWLRGPVSCATVPVTAPLFVLGCMKSPSTHKPGSRRHGHDTGPLGFYLARLLDMGMSPPPPSRHGAAQIMVHWAAFPGVGLDHPKCSQGRIVAVVAD